MSALFRRRLLSFAAYAYVKNFSTYLYSDPAYPTFTPKFGYGNKANGRADLRPTRKRIIIDGTTSTNGNYRHVASWSAALAIIADADWLLFKGGDTTAFPTGMGDLGVVNGVSATEMLVFGTFDPADPENDSKYNTLRHTLDFTGMPQGGGAISHNNKVSWIAFVGLIFFAPPASEGTNLNIANGYNAGSSNLLVEFCTFNGVGLVTQSYDPSNTASTWANISTIPDSLMMTDVTVRQCGSMYASHGNGGNSYAAGLRRYFYEGGCTFHGGWGSDMTRSTPAAGDATYVTNARNGPNLFKHNIYVNEQTQDVRLMEVLSGWDSSNLKLTGGDHRVQNLVTIRHPIAFLYSPIGNNSISWPNGSTMRCDNHLQVSSDDIRSASISSGQGRGWGPGMYQAVAGSYYRNGLMLNNDAPQTGNYSGVIVNANGSTNIPVAVEVSGLVQGNWGGQTSTVNPDAYSTITYTGNVWSLPTSGSNTTLTAMPALFQSRLAVAMSRNIHTTLRLAYPEFFGSVTPGTDALDTERKMFEFMVNNPIPDQTRPLTWAAIVQTHFREAMAGV